MNNANLGEMSGFGSLLDQTMAVMEGSVNTWSQQGWTRKVALGIVQRAGAKTPHDEAVAVWSFVRNAVRYRRDPENAEWIQTPFTTLVEACEGDCDDMATAAGALLASLGHIVRPLAVQWKGREYPSHAVLEDVTAGVIVDPVTVHPDQWPPHAVEKLIQP